METYTYCSNIQCAYPSNISFKENKTKKQVTFHTEDGYSFTKPSIQGKSFNVQVQKNDSREIINSKPFKYVVHEEYQILNIIHQSETQITIGIL